MTFTLAVSKLDPDVIVFLGDMLNEGSQTESSLEFEGFATRINDIFRTKTEIPVNICLAVCIYNIVTSYERHGVPTHLY